MTVERHTDVAVIAAARAGDARALDQLIADYLPLVYNIVGRALSGHVDVDDVVQETMLRVVHGLDGLRDPANFRSWLVAITVRQIRDRWRDLQFAKTHSGGLSPEWDVADPGSDFVDLTIMRLGLSGQRRQVAEATGWLDPDDQQLLSLWWLEAAGELDRADVVAALQLTPQHAAVRVQRMRAQLEAARAVVRALWSTPRCPQLTEVIRDWDGHRSPLWRKRVARHTRECPNCVVSWSELAPAEGLLSGLALVPLPAATAGHIMSALNGASVATHGLSGTPAASIASETASWLARILQLPAGKPIAAITAGVVAATSAGVAYQVHPRPTPPPVAAAPAPSASPSIHPTRARAAQPSRAPRSAAPAVAKSVYGTTVDQIDARPPVNRRPKALPERAQETAISGVGKYDPAGGKYQMKYRGDYVTLSGQGYFWVRWQLASNGRAGAVVMPTWTGLSGRLFHVASGGGRRMDDAIPGATDQPHTWMGQPSTGYDTLPDGTQQMWQNEYYYLDGTVTLHQNEGGGSAADYNLIVMPKTWDEISADIMTPPDPAKGVVRYGFVRDTGDDDAPVPQYLTRNDPKDPSTVPQLSEVS